MYFFKRVGGVLQELFDDGARGAGKMGLPHERGQELLPQHCTEVRTTITNGWMMVSSLKTARGDQITLTRDQALELYAIDKREKTNKQQGLSTLLLAVLFTRTR